MTEEHSSPIKTPKQLIIVVLLAFAVPITLAVMVSQLVTSGEHGSHENDSLVLSRIQPIGNVVLAEATGPKGMLTGEQVYGQVCKTCHDTGLAGSPKLGDKAAWAKVGRKARSSRSNTRSAASARCRRRAATAT